MAGNLPNLATTNTVQFFECVTGQHRCRPRDAIQSWRCQCVNCLGTVDVGWNPYPMEKIASMLIFTFVILFLVGEKCSGKNYISESYLKFTSFALIYFFEQQNVACKSSR